MIGVQTLIAGLQSLDLLMGIAVLILALLTWRDFRGSTYGNAFLIFAFGWVLILIHSVRELQYSLGMFEEFPTLWAASFVSLGVVAVSISYYLIYRDSR